MRLIGMLDSPYVRRVAVSLKFRGSRLAEALPDVAQDDEIDRGDREQKKRRGAGADEAADDLEG